MRVCSVERPVAPFTGLAYIVRKCTLCNRNASTFLREIRVPYRAGQVFKHGAKFGTGVLTARREVRSHPTKCILTVFFCPYLVLSEAVASP